VTSENDCEDQGFTRIADGCFVCLPTFDAKGRSVRPKFVKQKSPSNASLAGGGPLYWVCPKCRSYYGAVRRG
jgi:hypothetical protein